MIHIIYHGYFSFTIHKVVADFTKTCGKVLAKAHTDYALEHVGGKLRAVDLKGDPRPSKILFFDKDIRLARALAEEVPVYNSPRSIEIADDKLLTWEALAGHVPMIDTIPGPFHYKSAAPKEDFLRYVEKCFGYPMVVKAAKGSFGEQVFLAENRDELVAIAENIGSADYLLQRYVKEAKGVDKRVIVVGDEILGAIERRNPTDFRANIDLGGSARPVSLTEEESAMALKAHRLLGLTFSGIDLIQSKDGPLLVEVNSNMSYLGFQRATGIDVTKKILRAVE